MMYSLLVFATLFLPLEEIIVSDGSIRVTIVTDDPTWSRHSRGRLREVQVVRDTMVFIACVDPPVGPTLKAVREFVACLHGPPYLCGPGVNADGTSSPDYQDWWWLLPARVPPSTRRYVCINDLSRGGCVMLDQDFDGDVDLADWAIFLAELSRSPLLRHGGEKGYCGQDPNTRSTCSPDPTPWRDLRP